MLLLSVSEELSAWRNGGVHPAVGYLSHRLIAFCLGLSYLNAESQKTTIHLITTGTIKRSLSVHSHSVLAAALEER